MLQNIKALIVVLTLGSFVFFFGQKIWLKMMPKEDFRLRRNTWYLLTIVAFLSPNFWIFFFIAAPVMVRAGQRDSNPLALYVFLSHIVPPTNVLIPMVGINYLFDINIYRLLVLTILLPYSIKLFNTRSPRYPGQPGLGLPYLFIFLFSAIQIVQLIPSEEPTNTFRRTFLIFLDSIALIYAFSRGADQKGKIQEILGTFLLIFSVIAPIALFESLKGWVLYLGITERWQTFIMTPYLMRGDSLRAPASVGHALTLGYLLAIAFGIWLYLSNSLKFSKFQRLAGAGWIWLGLIATYSRAPWLIAIMIMFLFGFFMPRGTIRVLKMGTLAAILSSMALATPAGKKILDILPFIGTTDTDNVIYRQRLAEAAWELWQQYPWFGTPHALQYLDYMRQGEGIVDLVNTYATVAIFHGSIGLFLFCGYFLLSLYRTWKRMNSLKKTDPDQSMLGACLAALLLGTYVFMATGSFGTGLEQTAWILSALGLAYSRLPLSNEKQPQR
ncbi:MAG: O-antigen ligase family protein [Acidovorax sp.]